MFLYSFHIQFMILFLAFTKFPSVILIKDHAFLFPDGGNQMCCHSATITVSWSYAAYKSTGLKLHILEFNCLWFVLLIFRVPLSSQIDKVGLKHTQIQSIDDQLDDCESEDVDEIVYGEEEDDALSSDDGNWEESQLMVVVQLPLYFLYVLLFFNELYFGSYISVLL